jgi:hypothetical protein
MPRPASRTDGAWPPGALVDDPADPGWHALPPYQLTIPEGALAWAVTVSMTPIATVGDLPEG